jgi:hypothetical protein
MQTKWEDKILANKRGDKIQNYKWENLALAYKWKQQITMPVLKMGWVRPRTGVQQLTSSV